MDALPSPSFQNWTRLNINIISWAKIVTGNGPQATAAAPPMTRPAVTICTVCVFWRQSNDKYDPECMTICQNSWIVSTASRIRIPDSGCTPRVGFKRFPPKASMLLNVGKFENKTNATPPPPTTTIFYYYNLFHGTSKIMGPTYFLKFAQFVLYTPLLVFLVPINKQILCPDDGRTICPSPHNPTLLRNIVLFFLYRKKRMYCIDLFTLFQFYMYEDNCFSYPLILYCYFPLLWPTFVLM